MNDLSVKLVESVKDQAFSPSTLAGAEHDLDPLAIEDAEPSREPCDDKPGNHNCDDDAKDKKLNEESQQQIKEAETEVPQNDIVKEEEKPKSPAPTETEQVIKENVEEIPKNEVPQIVEPSTSSSHRVPETVEKIEKPIEEVKEPEVFLKQEPNPKKESSPINEPSSIKDINLLKEPSQVKEFTPIRERSPIREINLIKEKSPIKELNLVKERSSIKEPNLIKEASPVKEVSKKEIVDVEMSEVPKVVDKIEQRTEEKPSNSKSMNGDVSKNEPGSKRRSSEEIEAESPLKRLCQEVERSFPQHDAMINNYIDSTTRNNIDEIQRSTEQLLTEIQTLRELAQKKEHEWNHILHMKKIKEEMLLRLLRRKQVISFEKSAEVNVNGQDPFDYLNQAKNLAIDKSDEISGLALKPPTSSMSPMMQVPLMPVNSPFNPMGGLPPPYDKAHLQSMPKPVFSQPMMMPGPMTGFPRDKNGQLPGSYGLPMGRQGPTKDVKSIIADYRQQYPDVTPRRGRRMKSILNPNMMNAPRPIAPKVDMANLSNISMLFNNMDMNQKTMLERLQQLGACGGLANGLSFKDVLVQFANMQQNQPGLIPNRPMDPGQLPARPEHHIRPESRRRERVHEERPPGERMASPSPRLPPPPPYPEISLLPVSSSQDPSQAQQQNSLLHGILTKQASTASQSFSPTLAKLLTSPERKQGSSALPTFGQAKNCGEITITPVQPTPPPQDNPTEKTEEVVQLDDDESAASEGEASGSPSGSGSGRLVIDETSAPEATDAADGTGDTDTPLCQGCRRRDAQFVCAGCANQWYCSRDCQVAAWDEHSEMCSG